MFAALRFRINTPPVIRVGILQISTRSLFVKVKTMRSTLGTKWKWALLSLLASAFMLTPDAARAQGADWWNQYKAQCRAKGGTICEVYNECGGVCTIRPPTKTPGNAGNPQGDNGATAEGAAAAQRQRDAELEQQRIDAENKRRAEELAKQAKFDQGKQEALGQLKGISKSGDFDSVSGLKGVSNSSNSLALKTLPDVNTDTSVVDLRDTNLADANKALMRHQWAMSVDQRYKDDPQLRQYIRHLWDSASKDNTEALNKIRSILTDQLKVSGLTQHQVDDFFATFDTFTTGHGPMPKAWDRASTLAHEIDAAAATNEPRRPYYQELVNTLEKTQGIKATVVYMGTGPQTAEDCVLHAISNGAQVPFAQVKATLEPTLKNLAIARSEVRKNPELAITSQKKGGLGGLNPFEEIVIAKQFGNVIGVPDKDFAKAIESTGRPVITAVVIDAYNSDHDLVAVGSHEVAVTGVYRTADGKLFYSVMDSNLKTHANFTAYVEKNDFENHMVFGGGYVVVPAEKH
jgi:hypothetical protein